MLLLFKKLIDYIFVGHIPISQHSTEDFSQVGCSVTLSSERLNVQNILYARKIVSDHVCRKTEMFVLN